MSFHQRMSSFEPARLGGDVMNLMMVSICPGASSAPFVKSPDSSLRPAPSRARTPAEPTRSSLSIARSTVPRRSRSLSDRPAASNTPSQSFERVREHHYHLGIGGGRRGADGIGVALDEFAKTTRSRLVVAKDSSDLIATEGPGERMLV